MFTDLFLFSFLFFVIVVSLFMAESFFAMVHLGVPFVPSTKSDAERMAELLSLQPGSLVIDPGCGNGYLLLFFAERFPECRFIGYELSWLPFLWAKFRARRFPNLSIERKNFFAADFSLADAVICYLFPGILQKLALKLEKELKKGAAVISVSFDFPNWQPEKVIPKEGNGGHELLVYRK